MAETQHFFPEHLMRRVFTKEFVSRLEAVNRVARELRAMNYRLVHASLTTDMTVLPTITVMPHPTQIQPLLALGRGCTTQAQADGSHLCSIHYQGIRVVWTKSRRAKELMQ